MSGDAEMLSEEECTEDQAYLDGPDTPPAQWLYIKYRRALATIAGLREEVKDLEKTDEQGARTITTLREEVERLEKKLDAAQTSVGYGTLIERDQETELATLRAALDERDRVVEKYEAALFKIGNDSISFEEEFGSVHFQTFMKTQALARAAYLTPPAVPESKETRDALTKTQGKTK